MNEMFSFRFSPEKIIYYLLQLIMTTAITVSVGYIRSIAETIHKLEINMVVMAEKQLSHQKFTENHEYRINNIERQIKVAPNYTKFQRKDQDHD